MPSTKRDFIAVTVLGGAVGILAQPVLANILNNITLTPTVRGGVFVGFLLLAPTALFVAKLIARIIPVVYQIAKFAAVGSLNSFVDLGILNLGILALGESYNKGAGYAVIKAGSFLVAATNSYIWNKLWTFESKGGASASEAAKFYTITILNGLVNVAIASFVVNIIPHGTISNELWANVGGVVGILSAMTFNFLGYKFVVFRKKAGEAPVA